MNIVIVGAGYAGLRAALELSQQREDGMLPAAEITLVDREPYHQLVVLLHMVATAANTPHEVARPLPPILNGRNISLRQGTVTALDKTRRQVQLADGTAVAYDRLILSLGTTTAYGNVSGAREHTLPMRTYAEAVALREHIFGCFNRAAKTNEPQLRRRLMTVAIVGGGYTGIQLAGELGVWLPQLAAQNNLDPADIRIALVDRGTRLIEGMGGWASNEARRVLDGLRVSVYLDLPVVAVEPGVLLFSDERRLRAETLVWVGGVEAPALLKEAGLSTGRAGRVIVDEYLRAYVDNQQVIYAAGDCAYIVDPEDGKPVPTNASYALRQGDYLARQIAAELRGGVAVPYEPSHLGELVSIGPGNAVGSPLGIPVTGLPAAILKRGVEEWYLTTLEPGSIGSIL